MSEEKKKLIIKREFWARGGKNGDAQLLNPDGAMCCLGFACKVLGLEDKLLRDQGTPDEVANEYLGETADEILGAMVRRVECADEGVDWVSGHGIDDAVWVNDDTLLSDDVREARLVPILAELGFDVEFVGDPNLLIVTEQEE